MDGRVVGNYEIVERLGEGGMGTVWRAVDVMLERSVAIKAIRADLAAEPQIVERFRSEAKILARVHHPAIATIYSFFRDGGELYLAMEFVRGRSLAGVLVEDGALPWPRAVPFSRRPRGDRAGPPRGDHPSRPETGQPDAHRGRRHQGDGLRHRASGRQQPSDPHRLHGGDAALHVPRAAPRRGGGPPRRPLRAWASCSTRCSPAACPSRVRPTSPSSRRRSRIRAAPPGSLVPALPGGLERIVLKALEKSPDARFQTAEELRTALAGLGPLPLRSQTKSCPP